MKGDCSQRAAFPRHETPWRGRASRPPRTRRPDERPRATIAENADGTDRPRLRTLRAGSRRGYRGGETHPSGTPPPSWPARDAPTPAHATARLAAHPQLVLPPRRRQRARRPAGAGRRLRLRVPRADRLQQPLRCGALRGGGQGARRPAPAGGVPAAAPHPLRRARRRARRLAQPVPCADAAAPARKRAAGGPAARERRGAARPGRRPAAGRAAARRLRRPALAGGRAPRPRRPPAPRERAAKAELLEGGRRLGLRPSPAPRPTSPCPRTTPPSARRPRRAWAR